MMSPIHCIGTNHWVHDVGVSNRDECITVKSPASNLLIENIYCNQSGGSAIGCLAGGTAIKNIVYKNVYTTGGNQMFMIKSNGGHGYVTNVLFQNFLATGTAYGLDIDQYWSSQTTAAGDGVTLTNITFEVISDLSILSAAPLTYPAELEWTRRRWRRPPPLSHNLRRRRPVHRNNAIECLAMVRD